MQRHAIRPRCPACLLHLLHDPLLHCKVEYCSILAGVTKPRRTLECNRTRRFDTDPHHQHHYPLYHTHTPASMSGYDEHQRLRTKAVRLLSKKNYSAAITLLHEGSVKMLKASEQGSGCDLAIYLVDVYGQAGVKPDAESRSEPPASRRLKHPTADQHQLRCIIPLQIVSSRSYSWPRQTFGGRSSSMPLSNGPLRPEKTSS